nr:isochorismatase family protein [Oligoflexus tunisiensis]
MSIPRIPSYDLPDASSFPSSKVNWAFHPERAVLLIHDVQDYFLEFYGPGSQLVRDLLQRIQGIRTSCKQQGIPVIYTAQPINQTPEDRGLLNDMWGPGIDNRQELQAIVTALAPDQDDIVLTKWRYSAFQRSSLQSMMQEMQRDQILICGIYGHIGCLMTAVDAFMRDIKPFVIGDAIADFSMDEHMMALRYVAGRCGRVIAARDLGWQA